MLKFVPLLRSDIAGAANLFPSEVLLSIVNSFLRSDRENPFNNENRFFFINILNIFRN